MKYILSLIFVLVSNVLSSQIYVDGQKVKNGSLKIDGIDVESVYLDGIKKYPSLFGELVYYDTFENGTAPWNVDGEYNTGQENATSTIVVEPTALSPTHVLRMRSDDTAMGSVSRTNNMRYHSWDNTDDIIVRFNIKLPQLIDHIDDDNSFTNLWQTKCVDDLQTNNRNDPLWVLGIQNRGDKAIGGANYLSLSYLGQFWPELGEAQYKVTEIGSVNIEVDTWHKIAVRYHRNNGNGAIQVYQNDVLTHTVSGVNTFPSNLTPHIFHSLNNYGEGRIGKNALGVPTGLGYTDILVDDYGIYEYTSP